MKRTVAVLLTAIMMICALSGCRRAEEPVEVSVATAEGDGCVVIDLPEVTPIAAVPTEEPTPNPPTQIPVTQQPTSVPATQTATAQPTTPAPTQAPTNRPTATPTAKPTATPTARPTPSPTPSPEPIENLNYIPGYVNANGVNMRESPSVNANVLEVYSLGKSVYITGRNSEWYRVQVDGLTGYIIKRFITIGNYATPTPRPTATPTPKPTATPTPKPTAVPDYYTVTAGEFSESDVILVAKLLTREGPGSTYVGLRAIASVVLNRVKNTSGHFPNTVPGVLYQSGQFYAEGELDNVTPTSASIDAARYVFQQHGATLPKKVLFYKASYLGTEWYWYLQYYCTIEANNYFLAVGGGY